MRRLMLLGMVAVLAACSSPEEKEAASCKDSISAYVMSQKFVIKQLKSPPSAKFPSLGDAGVEAYYLSTEAGCKHYVEAYVDAQNTFGATIRSKYYVIMEKVRGKDSWLAHDLEIK